MKADPEVQLSLLELREVDTRIAQIDRELASSPLHEAVSTSRRALVAADEAAVTAATRVADLNRQVIRAEQDVQNVRNRIDRDRRLLDSGSVAAKQMTDLEHELTSLARRQAQLEDTELELLQEVEDAQATARAAQQELAAAGTSAAEAEADWSDLSETLSAEKQDRLARRRQITADVPSDVLAVYERGLERAGAGVGLLRHGQCGACQLELPSSDLDDLRQAAPDDIVRCQECGAILVRTAESGL